MIKMYMETTDLSLQEIKELAALPKHYNISFIETLIRDPLWTFVFWEIKKHDRDLHESSAHFDGYRLRVVPLKEDGFQPDMAASFTVAVGRNDCGWYLDFPPNGWHCYKIELCASHRNNCDVLAESHPFFLPRLIQPRLETASMVIDKDEEIQSLYRNPLAQLSGIDNFLLYRGIDRRSRTLSPEQIQDGDI
jgi:hypothetical protein